MNQYINGFTSIPPIGIGELVPVPKLPTKYDFGLDQIAESNVRMKDKYKRTEKTFEGKKLGVNTIMFFFNTDDLVDPDSITLELEIANPNKYNYLQLDNSVHSLIKSTKWVFRDKILENITDYNVLLSLLNDINYRSNKYADNTDEFKNRKEEQMPLTYGTREKLLHPRVYGTEFIFNNRVVQESFIKKHDIVEGKIDLRPKSQDIFVIPIFSYIFCNGPQKKKKLLNLKNFRGLQLYVELNEFAFFVPCFNTTINELMQTSYKDDVAYESYYNFMSDYIAIQRLQSDPQGLEKAIEKYNDINNVCDAIGIDKDDCPMDFFAKKKLYDLNEIQSKSRDITEVVNLLANIFDMCSTKTLKLFDYDRIFIFLIRLLKACQHIIPETYFFNDINHGIYKYFFKSFLNKYTEPVVWGENNYENSTYKQRTFTQDIENAYNIELNDNFVYNNFNKIVFYNETQLNIYFLKRIYRVNEYIQFLKKNNIPININNRGNIFFVNIGRLNLYNNNSGLDNIFNAMDNLFFNIKNKLNSGNAIDVSSDADYGQFIQGMINIFKTISADYTNVNNYHVLFPPEVPDNNNNNNFIRGDFSVFLFDIYFDIYISNFEGTYYDENTNYVLSPITGSTAYHIAITHHDNNNNALYWINITKSVVQELSPEETVAYVEGKKGSTRNYIARNIIDKIREIISSQQYYHLYFMLAPIFTYQDISAEQLLLLIDSYVQTMRRSLNQNYLSEFIGRMKTKIIHLEKITKPHIQNSSRQFLLLNEIKSLYKVTVSREYDLISYFCSYHSYTNKDGSPINYNEPWEGTSTVYKLLEKRDFNYYPPNKILFSLPSNNVKNIFQIILLKIYEKYPTYRMTSRYNRHVKNYWIETDKGKYPKLLNQYDNTSSSNSNFLFENLKKSIDVEESCMNQYNTAIDTNTQLFITKKLNSSKEDLFLFSDYANFYDDFFFGYFTEINSKAIFSLNMPTIRSALGIGSAPMDPFFICFDSDLKFEKSYLSGNENDKASDRFNAYEMYTFVEGSISYKFNQNGDLVMGAVNNM